MNFKKFLTVACFAALLGSVVFTSCRRNALTDDQLESASDNTLASGTSQDAQNISDQAFKTPSGTGFRFAEGDGMYNSACVTVTKDTVNKVVTVDFGTTPCLCKDGRYRQGQVIANYTDKYFTSGAIIDISFNNYYVGKDAADMNQVTGTKHIVNNGNNTAGNMNWTITSALNIIKANSGGTVVLNETRDREWIAGASTPLIWSDDKYQVTGSATGTSAKGTAFTAQVVTGSPLIRDMSCPKHFTQGQLSVTPSGKPAMIIDFGSGTCDNTATVTRNGKTKTITLK